MSENNINSTIQNWLDNQEGMLLNQTGTRRAVKCDYCSGVIHPNTTATHYFSDCDLTGHKEGDLYRQRLYCAECDRQQIRLPCHGVLELLVEHRVTDDHRTVEWNLRDASTSSEGLPWDPDAVLKHGLQQEEADFSAFAEVGTTVGPEDVIDQLMIHGLDPRDVIADDGSVRMDPVAVAQREQTINDRLDKLQNLSDREWTQLLRDNK